jgi:hypothetical protein
VFSDGTKQWSADSLSPGSEFWKLTLDKLEPKISTNYINTDSSYYIKGVEFIKANHNLGNQFIGIYSGIDNTTGNSNTSSGASTLVYNTTGINNSAFGTSSLCANITGNYNTAVGRSSITNNKTGSGNTAIGYRALYSDTAGSNNIAIGYLAGNSAQMSNRLWIGSGDSNNAIIYGEMLTRPRIRINGELFATNILVNQSATIGTNLTVHGEIINGGLINKDTVITIADSTSHFAFPTSSTGWAEIYIDSLGYIVSFANAYWGIDGAVTLINKGTNVVTTNTDDKHCIFDEGSYCALINRRASSYKYMIKFHYHN